MTVTNNVKFSPVIERKITRLFIRFTGVAARAEQEAKANVPWQDQTGDARRDIQAQTFNNGNEIGITLGHGVEYGPYLETANDGKYAVLKPTLDRLLPEVKQIAQDEFVG